MPGSGDAISPMGDHIADARGFDVQHPLQMRGQPFIDFSPALGGALPLPGLT